MITEMARRKVIAGYEYGLLETLIQIGLFATRISFPGLSLQINADTSGV